MKMAKRKLKRLDGMGVRVISKTPIVARPGNRAQRRAKARVMRKLGVEPHGRY